MVYPFTSDLVAPSLLVVATALHVTSAIHRNRRRPSRATGIMGAVLIALKFGGAMVRIGFCFFCRLRHVVGECRLADGQVVFGRNSGGVPIITE